MTRSSNSGRHSANRFLLFFIVRRSVSLRYSFRLSLYFRLPNGAAAKQRGRTPGAGVTCTGSFVSALLFLRAHHPIPPSLPSLHSLPPFHNFPFLCMVLATSSNHWVPRRDKKENGTWPEGARGGGGRRGGMKRRKEKSRPVRKRWACARKVHDRKYRFFSARNRLFKGRRIKELVGGKGIRRRIFFFVII